MSFRVAIIRLGRISGKTKYALVDEKDIVLAEDFAFEARLEVNRDGEGCSMTAVGAPLRGEARQALPLHDLVWKLHLGAVPDGSSVAHRNGLRMDNRRDNLLLVPVGSRYNGSLSASSYDDVQAKCLLAPPGAATSLEAAADRSLYTVAMCQMPVDAHEEVSQSHKKCFTSDGEVVFDDDSDMYYECHFAPCCRLEQELREFSICGRCQQTRYCGVSCQQKDWLVHKRFCREPALARPRLGPELGPER